MLRDELEAMLTEELTLSDIKRRLDPIIATTSITNALYDLHEEGLVDIILCTDKEIRYKLRGPPLEQ